MPEGGEVARPFDGRRTWGVTCQLPTTRSTRSWGIGDLGDLRRLARWVTELGGEAIAVGPLCDQIPATPRQPSPYFASSRHWLDPNLICIDEIPGASGLPGIAALSAEGRALNDAAFVDRDRSWALKHAALRSIHVLAGESGSTGTGLGSDTSDAIDNLVEHARFCALAQRYGGGWTSWPQGASLAVDQDEIAFWVWLQQVARIQLDHVRAEIAVIGDLPIGTDPSGTDGWTDHGVTERDCRVGAPPDEFNRSGQHWGIVPWDPARLASHEYEPLRSVMRANLAMFDGLRIDHVMGLFRLWWIPAGGPATDGHYATYDSEAQLGVVIEEALRCGTFVVGEDLGTVGDGVRERLGRAGIAGMKLAWFERQPAEEWPAATVGMLTNHDLPTVVGALRNDAAGMGRRIREFGEVGVDATEHDVVVAAHRRLAGSGSSLVLATLEDVVGTPWQVNVPGTTDEYPNWSRALPIAIDDLATSTGLAVLEAVAER